MAIDLEKGGKGSLKEIVSVVRTFAKFRPFTIQLEDGTRRSFDSLLFANIAEPGSSAAPRTRPALDAPRPLRGRDHPDRHADPERRPQSCHTRPGPLRRSHPRWGAGVSMFQAWCGRVLAADVERLRPGRSGVERARPRAARHREHHQRAAHAARQRRDPRPVRHGRPLIRWPLHAAVRRAVRRPGRERRAGRVLPTPSSSPDCRTGAEAGTASGCIVEVSSVPVAKGEVDLGDGLPKPLVAGVPAVPFALELAA